jgi:putative membrane protein
MKLPTFDDPRVPLAAERTLLAWVRTGLALMGFGFVVARFGLFLDEVAAARGGQPLPAPSHSVWIGASLVALGAAVNLLASVRHVRLLRRLAQGSAYQPSEWSLGVVMTVVVAALGLALTVYLLSGQR